MTDKYIVCAKYILHCDITLLNHDLSLDLKFRVNCFAL